MIIDTRTIALLIALLLVCMPSYAEVREPAECTSQECRIAEQLKTIEVFVRMDVERIIDGDTFVGNGKKVRLWGINAPEKDEPAYLASKLLLQGLIKDKDDISCKFLYTDPYKRDVMHCFAGKSDIGSMMVQVGMARDYKKYSGGYYQHEQGIAKEKQLGIWSKP